MESFEADMHHVAGRGVSHNSYSAHDHAHFIPFLKAHHGLPRRMKSLARPTLLTWTPTESSSDRLSPSYGTELEKEHVRQRKVNNVNVC